MDRLGSGVRNVTRYVQPYAQRAAEFIEGDIFRTVVPVPSYQMVGMSIKSVGAGKTQVSFKWARDTLTNDPDYPANFTINFPTNGASRRRLTQVLYDLQNGLRRTAPDWAKQLGVTERTIKTDLKLLREASWISFEGPLKTGQYVLTETGQQFFSKPIKK